MNVVFNKPFSLAGLALGLIGVAAVTFLFFRLLQVNTSTVGFCYLIVVLGIATTTGFRVSALVSVIAMLCFNFFFLPPLGRFTIAEPANWVALFTFLLTALVASHLSDRARTQADEARRRQLETERLYSLSRSILLTEPSHPIGTQAAQSIAQIFDSPAVMILDGKTGLSFRGGPGEQQDLEQHLQEVVRLGNHRRDDQRDLDVWPVSLGGTPVGALAAVGIRVSDGAVQSMLNLVAIALERVRTEEAANKAEVARQSEEFKSVLLDAIAHEFKTPLTSLKAAATGLRTLDQPLRPDQEELSAIIEEETDRLSRLVTEAVKMAEIDAGKVKLQRSAVPVASLIHDAAANFEGRGAERISVDRSDEATLMVDPDLITLAIRQIFDNALKYSSPGLPVICSTTIQGDRILIRVEDRGPGIPEKDRERVFEKFYRRASLRSQVPGSGLGLHIAREIVRIHGGDMWVETGHPQGSVFCFALPLSKEIA